MQLGAMELEPQPQPMIRNRIMVQSTPLGLLSGWHSHQPWCRQNNTPGSCPCPSTPSLSSVGPSPGLPSTALVQAGPTCGVKHALGLARAAGGVQQEQGGLRIQPLGGAGAALAAHGLVPPGVPALGEWALAAGQTRVLPQQHAGDLRSAGRVRFALCSHAQQNRWAQRQEWVTSSGLRAGGLGVVAVYSREPAC